ncbi:hypothetical protein CRU87_09580 [Aliarcobacter trophiarum LMG 25534]|uniref:SAM-dependent methyltransferase n=1 Tax=Aliarcobacter trophiarum LMG 25534 TaxID=1032241 RepID=A0AAD0VL78_9BACT|nr:MnmC family methyltransferase [Aliarcobacter trophiarum]AXK47973.1 SAM-dependent methyltransferase [Aliarcobacter trophiarum LMG 25534]RXI26069.1 hypothetical protein CRU89_07220 [Aliarcobacter trophiarum]RXJ89313.1 hypothetical protein CRU87_09580 [Aliarcobacter trophiarum LMG 25534]
MKDDKLVTTSDGSHTLFSQKYNQHFHNTEDGGLSEALNKHIIPAFIYLQDKKEVNILDICFGLGYNSFATIYYILKNNLDIKINIYSPEFDLDLIETLKDFTFPKEFDEFKNIINELSTNQKYEDEKIKIEIFIGDAREYIRTFPENFFDIVYQDAFSSEVNFELWTKEYFSDIYKICKNNSIVTTYAISTNIRLSMYESGFYIYETRPTKRKITLGFKKEQMMIGKYIDMELKKIRNKDAKALFDSFI